MTFCTVFPTVQFEHSASVRRHQPSEPAKAQSKFQKKNDFVSLKEKVNIVAEICWQNIIQIFLLRHSDISNIGVIC